MKKDGWLKKVHARQLSVATLTAMMCVSILPQNLIQVKAAEPKAGEITLSSIENVAVDSSNKNIVNITFNGGVEGKITFLENGIFRYNVDPTGEFEQYATPSSDNYVAKIQAQPDNSSEYKKPNAAIGVNGDIYTITNGATTIEFNKKTALMTVKNGSKVIMAETAPLSIGSSTTQSLAGDNNENFYGGGTQNGRFAHKGKVVDIKNNGWVDGGSASPSPFYWSTNGYGIMRNTFRPGTYDFQNSASNEVKASHEEKEFDAYYFISDGANASETATEVLQDYYKVTGEATLLPEYAYYLAHLNCYNRDGWSAENPKGNRLLEDGKRYNEIGSDPKYVIGDGVMGESLNNTGATYLGDNYKGVINDSTYKYSARAVIDGHIDNNMPLGWFAPNDGYGCGYGQNGYDVKRDGSSIGVTERNKAVDENVANLKSFSDYANNYGVKTGLWTQAALNQEDSEKAGQYRGFQTLRDFDKEVNNGGTIALKTDVAWVGEGYAMGLNSVKTGYDTIAEAGFRPNVVSLYGWAGTQRYAGIWTGDQTGGEWEYIRFHIPTYIGQSLSGNPNVGSDMNGIFGGDNVIQVRDFQWKAFTQLMLDMDGWGSEAKKPYAHGDPYEGINRMYLKLKAQLMPYLYTAGAEATDGLPSLRAMFLNFPEDPNTYGTNVQYQFMYGDDFLVAPIYEDVNMDENGNDVRNGIYLPGGASQIWTDYFTGKQYRGGQTLNNYDAPIWKLPLFVKNGAIVPMYEDNNNPNAITDTNTKGLDKTKRIIEFWPEGETSYDLYEDNGLNQTFTKDQDTFTEPNYGGSVNTNITSKVDGNTATLTANASTGNYDGYDANRKSTFVVNVSEKPSSITAKNGSTTLDVVEAKSLEEFNTLSKDDTKTVYFYNTKPDLNMYAADDEAFKDTEIITTPKVYVKFARTNVSTDAQTLIINGFVNDGELPTNDLDTTLAVPTISVDDAKSTPRSITVEWNSIDDATGYDLEVDGVVNTILPNTDGTISTSYLHKALDYNSTHDYRIRTRAASGYSNWSELKQATSKLDPWKDVPESTATWSGTVYNNQGPSLAVDRTLQQGGDGFHSDGGQGAKQFVIDMKLAYDMDKLQYYPRPDNGNGTIKKFTIDYSLDGQTWKPYDGATGSVAFEFNTKGIDDHDCAQFSLDGIRARYIRITTPENTGFFAASEIVPYKKVDTKGTPIGDTNNDGVIDDGDITQILPYKGAVNKGEEDQQWPQVYRADINLNGIYDVYDYTYTFFNANGGTKKTGAVDGTVIMVPDTNSTTVTEGQEYTLNVYGSNMKNVNAFGAILDYDSSKFQIDTLNGIAIAPDIIDGGMENFSDVRTYADNTGYATLSVLNRGDKELLRGNRPLATIKVKALKDGPIYVPDSAMLIGPDHKVKETKVDNTTPEAPSETVVKYGQTDFNITMTNEKLPTDDGTNVSKLIQGGTYDGLFNGNKTGRDFQFTWSPAPTDIHMLPTDVKFTMKKPSLMTKVDLSNAAENSNGTVKKISAVVEFEDGTTQEFKDGVFNTYQSTYSFVISDANKAKKVKSVTVTPLEAVGAKMLTLCEIEFSHISSVAVSSIAFDKIPTKLYAGKLESVSAKVNPSDATNPYYTIESSDPEVAKVIKTTNGYSVLGLKDGTITLTATAAGDTSKKVTSASITVTTDRYLDDLNAAIAKADIVNGYINIYTAESKLVFTDALTAAKAVIADNTSTQLAVDKAQYKLEAAIAGLVGIGSDNTQADSENYIPSSRASIVSETNHADSDVAANILDGDKSTIWHSSYQANAKLPVDVVVDLGMKYKLSEVDYLARQNSNNGHIVKYRVEISNDEGDNKTWTPVVEGTLENDGNSLVKPSEFKKIKFAESEARYVKFIALNTLGNQKDKFASIAELEFFGTPVTPILATSITLDKDAITLIQSHQELITATLEPANTTDIVKFTTSDPKVTTVDRNGNVTAVGEGTATITATAHDGLAKTVAVTVSAAGFAELQTLVGEVDTILAAADTNAALATELKAANDVAKAILETATDKEIVDGYNTLKAAKDAYNKVVGEIATLEEYIDMDLTFYEEAGKAAFAAEVEKAKELLKDVVANKGAFAAQITALDAAKATMVFIDVTSLKDLITVVDVDLTKYVDDEAKTAYQAAVANAKAVAANPVSNKNVADTKLTLSNIIGTLTKAVSVDQISTLNELLTLLKAYDLTKYTDESQAAIKDAITSIEAALAKSGANTLSETEAATVIGKVSSVKPVEKPTTPPVDPEEPDSKDDVQISGVELPEGVTTKVETLSEALVATLKSKIKDQDFLNKYAFEKTIDIKFFNSDGTVYKIDDEMIVSIKLDEKMFGKDLKIVYISDDGEVTFIPSWVSNGMIHFKTTHNSTYAVVSSVFDVPGNITPPITNPSTPGTLPSTPNTGDDSSFMLWTVMLGAAGLAMLAVTRKRREEE